MLFCFHIVFLVTINTFELNSLIFTKWYLDHMATIFWTLLIVWPRIGYIILNGIKTTNGKRPFECCYVNKIMTPSEHNLSELCLNTAVVIEMVCLTWSQSKNLHYSVCSP